VNLKELLYNLATDKSQGALARALKFFLWLLSLGYGLVVRLLVLFYQLKPVKLGCKVISVGNITLGGTGKTVLVEAIARYLKLKGHKVAILSRGYGRVPSTQSTQSKFRCEALGDEPLMLEQNLKDIPVLVDADRIRAAKRAIRDYKVDTVILDDGFQQWRIKKDLDIVAIDAASGFGNRNMLPRGILREPLSSLKRADVFILTNTDLNPDTRKVKDYLRRINPAALICESIHHPTALYRINKKDELLNLSLLRGKTVALVCAIGNPDSFQNTIAQCGINISLSFRFPDHHRYSHQELENITQEAKKKNIPTLITTEKDAVKLADLATQPLGIDILVLRIAIKLKDHEQEFHNRLLRIYSA
jgi:tetraacyldisaccharide 4'-kinase